MIWGGGMRVTCPWADVYFLRTVRPGKKASLGDPGRASFIYCILIHLMGRVFANGPGESYKRLKKWYLIPPCLTLSTIRYVLRVKWSYTEKGVALPPIALYSSYWKGNLWVAPDYGHQLYLLLNEYWHVEEWLVSWLGFMAYQPL